MDDSPPGARSDWNQLVFDLYQERTGEQQAKWEETLAQRLKKTRLSLPLAAYAGRYTNAALGTVAIENSGNDLKLRTAAVDMPMSHWHVDTFLVEYAAWDLREFAEFRIGPDGRIKSVLLFSEEFEPAPED